MISKEIQKSPINLINLGCSKNLFDTENLFGTLTNSGRKVEFESSDLKEDQIVIINTCGFIASAKEESINTILHFINKKKEGKISKVFVMGCLSERYRDELVKEIPEVDEYFGSNEVNKILKRLKVDYKKNLISEQKITTPSHYAYLKISEGCNRKCSFCAIPLMRGKHISTPIPELIERAKKLVKGGVKEIILVGQDLSYYGIDLSNNQDLPELLQEMEKIEGLEWIRLHYLYPTGFPIDILEIIQASKKICSYIDIPLQHISNNILKSMKRGTTKEKTSKLIDQIRENVPNIHIRSTFMVGFPGESEEDFEELSDWLEKYKLDRVGFFTYSHEEDTSAFKLEDGVPEDVKESRKERLLELQREISYSNNSKKVGVTLNCIIDSFHGDYYIGRSEYDSPEVDNEIYIKSKGSLEVGKVYEVRINEAMDFDLEGEVVI